VLEGRVINENGRALPGAHVTIKGESYGMITNNQGKFKLSDIPIKSYKICVSNLGYETYNQDIRHDSTKVMVLIRLKPAYQEIDEVEVKSEREKEIRRRESISIGLIQEEFLKENRSGSLMETLNRIPGVHSINIGSGLSKPMIRGMGYYRVAVAQNGIKTEGQQWSNHHGLMADHHAVNHVEMIKGPATLRYGSDAMGGVINILPEHVPLSGGLSGEVSAIGKTNNQALGTSAVVSARRNDLYATIHASHRQQGDFQVPATELFVRPGPSAELETSHQEPLGSHVHNTAGRKNTIALTTGIVRKWGNSYLKLSYIENQNGFFDWQGLRYDSLQMLHARKNRDIQLPSQTLNDYSIRHHTNWYINNNKLEFAVAYQCNHSSEFSYLSDETGNRSEELNYYRNREGLDLQLDLHTYSANTVYKWQKISNHTFTFGINSQYQQHYTDGYSHILPRYNRLALGFFITHQYDISPVWILNTGVRYDYNQSDIHKTLNPDPARGDSVFNPSLNKKYPALSYSAGINFVPNTNTIYKLNLGKSYRVPSVYELAAYGLHRHEGRFEKGDIKNRPEQAWQLDIGFEKNWSGLTIMASPFLNYFTNYLYLNPTPELRREGQVYKYEQSKALITGGELSADFQFHNRFQVQMGAEYVYAVNLDLKSAIPFTPPFSLKSQFNYVLKKQGVFDKNQIGLTCTAVAAQNYTVPNELSTNGYIDFAIAAQTNINTGNNPVAIRIKVNNLLNNKYFNHISFYRRLRIPEPGRDVQLIVTVPFSINNNN
jgi:iron complex outermembrane receptor protein